MDFENKLYDIHNKLNFVNKNELKREIPEQLMALKHIKPDDIVLELGGSIGRNTCIISSILNNSSNFVTIEPNILEREKLQKNRSLNNFNFLIEPNVLSNTPLYSRGWYTYSSNITGSKKVSNITWNELKEKYNLKFNVLIIDNEGNFTDNLRQFSDILTDIELLSIEHDFNSNEDLEYFYKTMEENNFKMIDKYHKTQKYGPGMNWGDGIKTDPIFVSVWKK